LQGASFRAARRFADKSCCFSFDDLHKAAFGRLMAVEEADSLRRQTQDEKNATVREWTARTNGAFRCEDRLGTDGVTYTAFWRAET